MNRLAVVIPTLNEQGPLRLLLRELNAQRGIALELVVADGGSTDGTPEIAAREGAIVVHAELGRARQMNAGRAATTAPRVLFLHADSGITDADLLRSCIERVADRDDPKVCGHFKLKFRASGAHYRFLEAKTALNRPNTTNGDQGMLFDAGFFDELGGFDERLPFLEDQLIAESVRWRGGSWITLPGTLLTSARRFEAEGFGRSYFAMALFMGIRAAGADDFFDLAPGAYSAGPTGQLDLRPLFRALHETMRRMGSRRTARAWYDAGEFARQNAWQLFFAADVALADGPPDGDHPFLDLYDRVTEDLETPLLDLFIASAAFVVVAGVLPAWFEISERASSRAAR